MMTLTDLYSKIGGNYDDVMMRFVKDTRVKKFLGMFLNDPTFAELQTSVAASDWETAFRAAHTLKGVAGNMSFTKLQSSASELTEALRGGKVLEDIGLYEAVSAEYDFTVSNVKEFLAENP